MLLESLILLVAAAPTAPPPPAPVAPPHGGYWLSVELYGPAAARTTALELLTDGIDPRAMRDGHPPGEPVGHSTKIQTALSWIATHAFDPQPGTVDRSPSTLNLADAPVVAGRLRRSYGVQLGSFVITGATIDGDARTIDWPVDGATILPPDLGWKGGSLTVARAPLFAAPAPRLPPAAEAFATARRSGEVYILDWFDRCEPDGQRCMRWYQVVSRNGDRFTPGYLPAHLVAPREAWTRGQGTLPRGQLMPIARDANGAWFMLLARGRDNTLHRASLHCATPSGFGQWSLTIDGDWGTVICDGEAPRKLALDATLDARKR